MPFIYVIGAQCTGKTTLVEAVGAWLQCNMRHISFTTIQETARTTLALHHFTRDDIRPGGDRCMKLQKLILQHQLDVEKACPETDLVVSDRSGVDPLVYAQMYCGDSATQDMLQSNSWIALKSSMKTGAVIVCEPVDGWLFDDGIRLVPEDRKEWWATHMAFCEFLQRHQIPHAVLGASTTRLDERVKFVLVCAGVIDQ